MMHIWLPAIRTGTGTDRYTEKLAAALLREGVQATLSWLPLRKEVLPIGLRELAAPRSATHVHINTWMPVPAVGALPLLLTAHTASELAVFDRYKSPLQRLYHRYVIRSRIERNLQRAAAVCGVSPGVCALYRRAYSVTLHHIPNWLGPEDIHPLKMRGNGRPCVLFVGRPGWHKGSDLLPGFARRLTASRLICTLSQGEWAGHDFPENVELAGRLERVRLAALLQEVHVLVVPSRHEGFSLAALEAMAAGLPVVGFEGAGLEGLVCHGDTGFLVPMGNLDALAEAANMLLQDRARSSQMGRRAREWVVEQFAESRVIGKLIEVYGACMPASGSIEVARTARWLP